MAKKPVAVNTLTEKDLAVYDKLKEVRKVLEAPMSDYE